MNTISNPSAPVQRRFTVKELVCDRDNHGHTAFIGHLGFDPEDAEKGDSLFLICFGVVIKALEPWQTWTDVSPFTVIKFVNVSIQFSDE